MNNKDIYNNETEKNKYTWNDSVIIKKDAPEMFHPEKIGVVCGMSKIKFEEVAKKFHSKIGDWVYTIEFEDGRDIQIAEHYLDKNTGIISGKELSIYRIHFINGSISKIKLSINLIEIQMKSAPIHQPTADEFLISDEKCLSGRLIATQVEHAIIKNGSHSLGWQQEGLISGFEVSDHELKLSIEWDHSKLTSFEIKSGQIWWEKQM